MAVPSAAPASASVNAMAWVESTASNRCVSAAAIADPREAGRQLVAELPLRLETAALALDDVGRRLLHEVGARELAFEERDRLAGLADLLLEALALGGHVDDAGELDI